MTALFTASYRRFREEWGTPICTSRGLPKWRPESAGWARYWPVTPTAREYELTGDQFTTAYIGRLEQLGAARIARSLEALARSLETDKLILLCFEDSPACHRIDFANWWLAATGEPVNELT